jgi:hypothetical protein
MTTKGYDPLCDAPGVYVFQDLQMLETLLKDKRRLLAGIAHDQSIAVGCAMTFRAAGVLQPMLTTSRNPTSHGYWQSLPHHFSGCGMSRIWAIWQQS